MLRVLLSVLVSFCAQANEPYKTVKDLLKEGNSEAVRERRAKGELGEYDTELFLMHEKCENAVKECSGEIAKKHEWKYCQALLYVKCIDKQKMSEFFENLANKRLEELEAMKGKFEAPPTQFADKVKECQDGMKWGYFSKLKSKQNGFNPSSEELIGKFNSESECEEARLTDKNDFGQKCRKRNFGKNVNVNAYIHNYMVHTHSGNHKETLKFVNEEVCQNASKTGVKFGHEAGYDSEAYFIGPKGSKEETRFIGECTKQSIALCKTHKHDITNLDLIE